MELAYVIILTLIIYFSHKQNNIMATLEEVQALVASLQASQEQTATALTGIAEDIARIKASLPVDPGVVTQGQLDELAASLTAVSERASALAASAAALDAEN